MKKVVLYVLLVSMISMILYGCRSSPIDNVVISKNDDAFDINKIQSAADSRNTTQSINRSDVFFSTDGTVEFRFSIDDEITGKRQPVVVVEPHYLTEENAKDIAIALFGDAIFSEAEPLLDEVLTQNDIKTKIQRWSEYTSEAALSNLYGESGSSHDKQELVKQFIDLYTQMYENVPANDTINPCEWSFKKESYYRVAPEKMGNRDIENDNESIQASTQIGDIYYRFSALTRNKDDYKLNYVTAYLYDGGSPLDIDMRIFRANLCRTQEPTDKQIADVKAKADSALKAMQLGEWFIDQCFVEVKYYGNSPEYTINVNAVPVLNGIPAERRNQPLYYSNDNYAPNYDLTDVHFEYSADGKLVNFVMRSPIDIVEVVNDNANVWSIDALLDRAKQHLELSDYYEYGFGSDIEFASEELKCFVNISRVGYNLIRLRAPNTDASYYYVPGIVLFGDVEYIGSETGNTYYSNEDQLLVSLNGIDGSVIGKTN